MANARPPFTTCIAVVVRTPVTRAVPDTSKLPFKSTKVAAIWTSSSATISNCPSAEECMAIAASLNCTFLFVATARPPLTTWIAVM